MRLLSSHVKTVERGLLREIEGWYYPFYVQFKFYRQQEENVDVMSLTDKQGEVNRLLGEKDHLKKEEEALRKVIAAVKKQVSALQVEQLEIKNRVPLSRVSPSFFLGQTNSRPVEEIEGEQAELNLEVLNQMHSGTFVVQQEQEEDSD